MFLRPLLERNPGFVEVSMALHREGKIPANSYVLDLDAIEANARNIKREADAHGLTVLAMTKQVGRNPGFIDAVRAGGIQAGVAVDMTDAWALTRGGLALGHLGHLVQVPQAEADAAAGLDPTWWTVYSDDKATEAAAAAHRIGRTQNLLARIHAPGDTFYRGHEGGFPAADVAEVARCLDSLEGARFAGITTFPALLIDHVKRQVVPTPNLDTLAGALDALHRTGYQDLEVNAPGTTSSAVLEALAGAGATQIEPGHGFTGTTPFHVYEELPETPAVLYLTEVSHRHAGEAYCFGGGLYIDPVFDDYPVQALVAGGPSSDPGHLLPIEIPPPSAIDYYGMIDAGGRNLGTGDTVVLGFRIQAFVTRAYVVGVRGIATNAPQVTGIHDVAGMPAPWPR